MIFGGGSTLEQGVGGMPCCLSSTSCCPQPSCNVQTLVLCQPSMGRTPVPSSPSMLESKEERQTPPALALTLLGFIFSHKREIPKKPPLRQKKPPKSISVLGTSGVTPSITYCGHPKPPGRKAVLPISSTYSQPQRARGSGSSKGHFGATRGISAPRHHPWAEQGQAPTQCPRGTGPSLSQPSSEGKAQISQKWLGLGRDLPEAAGPAQPGSVATEVPAPQPSSSQGPGEQPCAHPGHCCRAPGPPAAAAGRRHSADLLIHRPPDPKLATKTRPTNFFA